MKKIKIGINGFGRIGRLVFNHAINKNNIEITQINDLITPEYIAYMLKYDSVHGKKYQNSISIKNNTLIIKGNKPIVISSQKNPNKINWMQTKTKYVIESTGLFLTTQECDAHIKSGAERVIISAPPKDATPMFVMGVNHTNITKNETIFSTASCTTNCLAPLVKIMHDKFKIIQGLMTTVHAATATQKVVDGPSLKDWRGGRCALLNVIPSSTGAAKAVGKIIPELNNKLTGMAFRVPVANVSVVDVTLHIKHPTNYTEITQAIKHASITNMKGILGYTEEDVVSTDFIGDTRTSIFDAKAGIMLNPNFVKLVSWYDNESGYSAKILEIIEYIENQTFN
jgi:glyceraldehyde 3-phosphate dehydrogenase